MKKLLILTTVFLCSLLFTQCRHYYGNWDVYFWKSNNEQTTAYLFIDGINKGELPYNSEAPECGEKDIKKKTLFLHLQSGEYHLSVKDANNKSLYNEKLTINRSRGNVTISTSHTDDRGGSKNVGEDECLIHEMYW